MRSQHANTSSANNEHALTPEPRRLGHDSDRFDSVLPNRAIARVPICPPLPSTLR